MDAVVQRAAGAAGAVSVAQGLVAGLQALGVEEAYGVPGGAMAALWHAMSASGLRLRHCRHETGAAFAAMEAHFASGRPVLLFTTTGPGLCNALTGLLAARCDGARLVVVSACTSAGTRGRGAIQESTPQSLPRGLYETGPVFDQAVVLEEAGLLPAVLDAWADGLQQPRGWIAHIAVPTAVATQRVPAGGLGRVAMATMAASLGTRSLAADRPSRPALPSRNLFQPVDVSRTGTAGMAPSPAEREREQDQGALRGDLAQGGLVQEDPAGGSAMAVGTSAVLDALTDATCALWVGHGALQAAAEVRALVDRTGIPFFCTPRAKGIAPETHPRFVGVTGIGGHDSVADWMQRHTPRHVIVLGTRLGEASSLLDPRLVPAGGFVHVDGDRAAFGAAYPEARTRPVVAEIGSLLRQVLARLPTTAPGCPAAAQALPRAPLRGTPLHGTPLRATPLPGTPLPCAALPCTGPVVTPFSTRRDQRVRPEVLMDRLQQIAIDEADATVIADSGNAFVWTTHRLRFAEPGRYRVSTAVGAMGHACAGAVGAALAGSRPVVAVVGDGAMLMHNEINTAVKYGARVVWIVLNDARWGMCAQGMQTLGLQADAAFPPVDFAAFARAQGADALRVHHEHDIEAALRHALAATGPCLLDVQVDTAARAPACGRNRGLAQAQAPTQTPTHTPAPAPAAAPHHPAELAFPAR